MLCSNADNDTYCCHVLVSAQEVVAVSVLIQVKSRTLMLDSRPLWPQQLAAAYPPLLLPVGRIISQIQTSVQVWGSKALYPTQHIPGHFRDESLETISCTGSDNQNWTTECNVNQTLNSKYSNILQNHGSVALWHLAKRAGPLQNACKIWKLALITVSHCYYYYCTTSTLPLKLVLLAYLFSECINLILSFDCIVL